MLDGARDRGLRCLQQRCGCDEASVFRQRENCLELTRSEIRDVDRTHVIYAFFAIMTDITNSLILPIVHPTVR
jgi:hypothetical protein